MSDDDQKVLVAGGIICLAGLAAAAFYQAGRSDGWVEGHHKGFDSGMDCGQKLGKIDGFMDGLRLGIGCHATRKDTANG